MCCDRPGCGGEYVGQWFPEPLLADPYEDPERSAELAAQVQRLTGRDQMGSLFKVLAIRAPGWPEPAGVA